MDADGRGHAVELTVLHGVAVGHEKGAVQDDVQVSGMDSGACSCTIQ